MNRTRATIKAQYHLDKKSLAKGDAFEMRAIQMPVALAAKARQGTLDHPRIEAQASRRQPTGAQISQQAFQQGGTLWQSHDGELVDRLLNQGDGLAKTQAVRIQLALGSGAVQQKAQPVVQQQHAIELLQHGWRTTTAQRLLGQAQMVFVFIDAQLHLPAFMIQLDQSLGGSLLGIEPSGDQAPQLAMAGQVRRIDAVGDHAQEQGLVQAVRGLRRQPGQVAAIGKPRTRVRQDMALQTCHDMGSFLAHGLDQWPGKQSAIQQHQHLGADRAQQERGQAGFSHPTGSSYRIEDGMSGALQQVQGAQLRKGTLRGARVDAAKVVGIVLIIGHILAGAIDRHHSSAPAEGTFGTRGGQWPTTAAKQLPQHGYAQLLPPLATRALGRHCLVGVGPQEACATGQAAQDSPYRQARKEGQGDHQVHDGHHRQRFLALLPGMAVAEYLLDGFPRVDFLQHFQVHLMTQLVILSYLSYAKGHQEAPFIWHWTSILTIVCHIWTSFSYLNGIDRKGPLPTSSTAPALTMAKHPLQKCW